MKKIIISTSIMSLFIAGSALALTRGFSGYLYQWYSTDPSRVGVDVNTGRITRYWTGSVDVCAQLKTDLSLKFCNTVN